MYIVYGGTVGIYTNYGDPKQVIEAGNLKQVFNIGSQLYHDEKNDCPIIIAEKLLQ